MALRFTGMPSIVTAAVIVKSVELTGWLAGADNVSIDVWPAVIDFGLSVAVIPEGTPVTASEAGKAKPSVLFRLIPKLTVWPLIKLAPAGKAVRVNPDEGLMMRETMETAEPEPTETVIGPVAAPAGTTN